MPKTQEEIAKEEFLKAFRILAPHIQKRVKTLEEVAEMVEFLRYQPQELKFLPKSED